MWVQHCFLLLDTNAGLDWQFSQAKRYAIPKNRRRPSPRTTEVQYGRFYFESGDTCPTDEYRRRSSWVCDLFPISTGMLADSSQTKPYSRQSCIHLRTAMEPKCREPSNWASSSPWTREARLCDSISSSRHCRDCLCQIFHNRYDPFTDYSVKGNAFSADSKDRACERFQECR